MQRLQLPIIAVGCCPSSGSTLLADLLDSVPGLLCGPELNILCVERAYQYDDDFKQEALNRSAFPLASATSHRSRFFNTRYQAQVGLDQNTLNELIAAAETLPEFVYRFAHHCAQFRGREIRAFAEKTPHNASTVGAYLAAFPKDWFIHIVRDGRSVVASLKRRGYSLFESALIWLREVQTVRRYRASPCLVEIRYEDLVAAPFEITARIAKNAGIDADPDDILKTHTTNEYRSGMFRLQQWRAYQYSGQIFAGLSFDHELSNRELDFLYASELVCPDGQRISFLGLLEAYGYPVKDLDHISEEYFSERSAEYFKASSIRAFNQNFALIRKTR